MWPLVKHLDWHRVPYVVNYTEHTSYLEHSGNFYIAMANDYSASNLVTSQLVTCDFMPAQASRAALTPLYRSVTALSQRYSGRGLVRAEHRDDRAAGRTRRQQLCAPSVALSALLPTHLRRVQLASGA
jgi:hypothetical protein